MFEFLSSHPTEADILTAVYEVKPKFNSKQARELLGPRPANRKIDEQSYNQLPSLMGQLPVAIPEEIRDGIKFAEEKMKKMKLMP